MKINDIVNEGFWSSFAKGAGHDQLATALKAAEKPRMINPNSVKEVPPTPPAPTPGATDPTVDPATVPNTDSNASPGAVPTPWSPTPAPGTPPVKQSKFKQAQQAFNNAFGSKAVDMTNPQAVAVQGYKDNQQQKAVTNLTGKTVVNTTTAANPAPPTAAANVPDPMAPPTDNDYSNSAQVYNTVEKNMKKKDAAVASVGSTVDDKSVKKVDTVSPNATNHKQVQADVTSGLISFGYTKKQAADMAEFVEPNETAQAALTRMFKAGGVKSPQNSSKLNKGKMVAEELANVFASLEATIGKKKK